MVSQIDLVIECRDYRTPLVSRNPLFEANLGERPRLIVYTKQDLGSNSKKEDKQVWVSGVTISRDLADAWSRENKSSGNGTPRQLRSLPTSNPDPPSIES